MQCQIYRQNKNASIFRFLQISSFDHFRHAHILPADLCVIPLCGDDDGGACHVTHQKTAACGRDEAVAGGARLCGNTVNPETPRVPKDVAACRETPHDETMRIIVVVTTDAPGQNWWKPM